MGYYTFKGCYFQVILRTELFKTTIMKKTLFIASAAVAGLVFAACSNEKTFKAEDAQFEIGFEGVYVDNSTKVTTGEYTKETLEVADNTMGVFSWKSVGTASPYTETQIFKDQKVIFDNPEAGASREDKWGYTPKKYWDKNANHYSFYAYAPHSSDFTGTVALESNSANAFTITDFRQATTVADQIDLLTDFTTQANRTSFVNDVEFAFSHILSNINFKVAVSDALKEDETDNPVTLVSLALSAVKTGGDYAYNTDAYKWTAEEPATAFSATQTDGNVFASESINNVTDEGNDVPGMTTMLMVPQSIPDTYTLTVNYLIDEEPYETVIKLNDFKDSSATPASLAAWQSGYKYTYFLVIGPTPIEFGIASVSTWGDGGTYTYVIE